MAKGKVIEITIKGTVNNMTAVLKQTERDAATNWSAISTYGSRDLQIVTPMTLSYLLWAERMNNGTIIYSTVIHV